MNLREIAIQWLTKAKDIDAGKSIFVPCNNRNQRKKLVKIFEKELKVMGEIDPVASACLTVSGILKEGKHWLIISKKKTTPLIGWIKDDSGKLEKVELNNDPERERRLRLMALDDKMTDEEIEEIEGQLSSSDKHFLHSLRKECGLK